MGGLSLLLTIWVLPLLSVLLTLKGVSILGSFSHSSLFALEVTVIDDLKTSVMLLLKSPKAFFFLSLFLEKGLFDDLLVTLVKNGSLLLVVKTLKVVWLNTMRSQHGCHSCWVLSHEVISQSIGEFMILLLRPVLSLSQLSITLFFGELEIHLLSCAEHISALSLVLLLGLL
jgi:hypothetical protein